MRCTPDTLFQVLFRNMQEKLLVTEAKLKESQYHLAPWHSDVNALNFSPSPSYSYEPQTTTDWDLLGHCQSLLGDAVVKNPDSDDLGRHSPLMSRLYGVTCFVTLTVSGGIVKSLHQPA
ncbi:hypothetical protein ACH5RR_012822 [Cinchona calisaya]|uniref:Uncharacterized protein n=1 Tax=Cinchona calisaya TaxID=153742 RepID=A0ABD3A8N9_9GENT